MTYDLQTLLYMAFPGILLLSMKPIRAFVLVSLFDVFADLI